MPALAALSLSLALAQAAFAQQGGPRGGNGSPGPGGGEAPRDTGPRGARPGEQPSDRGGVTPNGSYSQLPEPSQTTLAPFPDLGEAAAPSSTELKLPDISGYAPAPGADKKPLAPRGDGAITLSAKLTEDGGDVSRGLVWRVFKPDADASGKLPLVASARGGTSRFDLDPGSYLVHASFGRAGATMRVTIGKASVRQTLVLDAGGLKLDATVAGDHKIPESKLRFSIYEAKEDVSGERALIIPDVSPNAVVRLNAGTYHVVSNYGDVNAVVRADIRVEAGKLTEANMEHRAAQLTLKLVREKGGEAMADTSWSVLTDGGDLVRESVGAYSSLVLAEGSYTVVAKNRERIYQRDLEVKAGSDEEVEVLATETAPAPSGEISD